MSWRTGLFIRVLSWTMNKKFCLLRTLCTTFYVGTIPKILSNSFSIPDYKKLRRRKNRRCTNAYARTWCLRSKTSCSLLILNGSSKWHRPLRYVGMTYVDTYLFRMRKGNFLTYWNKNAPIKRRVCMMIRHVGVCFNQPPSCCCFLVTPVAQQPRSCFSTARFVLLSNATYLHAVLNFLPYHTLALS